MFSLSHPPASSHTTDPELVTIQQEVVASLKKHTCYDVLPVSFKLIVFDTRLLVKKSLAALLQHGVQSAPLWDSAAQSYAGMLTVTDFIHLILYYYDDNASKMKLEDIDELQIYRLREYERQQGLLPLGTLSVHPMESLYNTIKLLLNNRLHRVPLVDSAQDWHPIKGTPRSADMLVSVMTQYKLVKFIAANCQECMDIHQTPKQLGLGTYQHIATATLSTPLITVLNLFIERRVSGIPILDDRGVVVDVCEKYDVLNLAREGGHYDLEMPISQVLHRRSSDFEGIHTCTLKDSLGALLNTIKTQTVHRFVVIESEDDSEEEKQEKMDKSSMNELLFFDDEEDETDVLVQQCAMNRQDAQAQMEPMRGRLKGVVSISDILGFFVRDNN